MDAAAGTTRSGSALESAGAAASVGYGETELRGAFMAAAAAGHADVLHALLQAEGKQMAAILASTSAKCAAAQAAFWAVLRIDDAQPPGSVLRCGDFALLAAAVEGHVGVCAMLLQQPAVDPAAASNAAIRLAVRHSHAGLVDLLLADARVDPFQAPLPPQHEAPTAPGRLLGAGAGAAPAVANPFLGLGAQAAAAVPAASSAAKCAVAEAHVRGSFVLQRLALHPRILHRLLRRDFPAAAAPSLSSGDIDVRSLAALAWRRRRAAVIGRMIAFAGK